MEFRTFLALLIFLWQSFGIYGFNLDTASPEVFDGPPMSEYFGYSVALHSQQNKYWVMVGAPLSNVTGVDGSTLTKYGAVYRCEYPGSQCQAIKIDDRSARTQSASNEVWDIEVKTGQWIGGSVYSTGTNGRALACAPRYVYRNVPNNDGLHYYWLLGKCFLISEDLSATRDERVPCMSEQKGNNYYGYCEAGISAEYTVGYDQDVVMGAVGIARWKGGVWVSPFSVGGGSPTYTVSPQDQINDGDYMGYSVTSGHFSSPSSTELVGGAPRGAELKGKVIIYNYDISNDQQQQISVSSPLPQPKNIPTGTYFGSVLCAVDLDEDEFSDILVGAPYYTHKKDEGRVYIYLNNGQGALNLQDDVLEGDKAYNAHFGAAIAAVGDLNKDGFQDVAVGAPFEGEDGSGAVYIYHGSSRGIETRYRQKIVGSKIKPGIKMFGVSISGGVDVDQNEYPDIAVGAYRSEQAVIVRTRSIVNVEGEIRLSKSQITLESNDSVCDVDGAKHKCLNMTVVFQYTDQVSSTNSQGLDNLRYSVELDKGKESDVLRRMFFWNPTTKKKTFIMSGTYNISAQNQKYSLPTETVYLLDKNEVADVGSRLTFDLSFSLPATGCNGLCPVLNSYLLDNYRGTVAFRKKCKNQLACVPDLAVDGHILYSPSTLDLKEVRIGVVREFTVMLTVTNKVDDSAYYSTITMTLPADLDYIGPTQFIECERDDPYNGTVDVTCNVGNPLLGKVTRKFGIKFAPGSVKENFRIEVIASSQDQDANDKDNEKAFIVPVTFEADLEVKGSTKQDQVVYTGPVKDNIDILESIGPEVVTTLTVRNKGPSTVDGTKVTVNFPSLFKSSDPKSYLLYLVVVELEGASGTCDAKVNPLGLRESNSTDATEDNKQSRRRRDAENMLLGCRTASCSSFSCNLGQLKLGDKVDIKMTFRLWINTLIKELDPPKAVDLETTAKIKVPSIITQPNLNNDQATIITTAKPAQTEAQKKKVAWWVILLSVLGGVLLVGGVVAGLYKCGFFKRKRIKDISGPSTSELNVM
ncbi:integrin alpha-9-like isoform X2 [Stylophora pistillata]|uniref:integrin alpha-9-like isoform X2 n=1 Tax=Stylophora pistillata TaxID=50429 RepID=UPI000C048536|nr:integrin alpha-9-like isoform X2 [Stylophora pistillata]